MRDFTVSERVETLLKDADWAKWSDREIARQCGVSHEYVRQTRTAICQPLTDTPATRAAKRNGKTCLHRPHLSAGQQAAIVASAQDWATAQKRGGTGANQHKEQTGNLAALQTVAQRAAESGASERTQRMADKVAKASHTVHHPCRRVTGAHGA